MKGKSFFNLMAVAFAAACLPGTLAQDDVDSDDTSTIVYEVFGDENNYVCGDSLADDKSYATKDSIVLCLFFNDSKTAPVKVVYQPVIDVFEALQVKGLYDNFRDNIEGNLEVTAMADGKRSRPAIFKKNLEVAQILNLIVVLDEGKIDALEWRNSCFDESSCRPDDCKDTSLTYNELDYSERNCFKSDCAVAEQYDCDSQVFLTWIGRDNDRDDCTSDNYRISGFTNFGIISYLDAAKKLVNL
jgi:hypothetical protein